MHSSHQHAKFKRRESCHFDLSFQQQQIHFRFATYYHSKYHGRSTEVGNEAKPCHQKTTTCNTKTSVARIVIPICDDDSLLGKEWGKDQFGLSFDTLGSTQKYYRTRHVLSKFAKPCSFSTQTSRLRVSRNVCFESEQVA